MGQEREIKPTDFAADMPEIGKNMMPMLAALLALVMAALIAFSVIGTDKNRFSADLAVTAKGSG